MAVGIGQRITERFQLVSPTVGTGFPTCEDNKFDCQYCNTVITDGTTDEFKNDKSDIPLFSALWTSAVTYTIQKQDEGTQVWADSAVFSNSYGVLTPLATYSSVPNFSGILIHWNLVYNAFGLGKYRIKIEQVNPTGTVTSYSKEYCLRLWNCNIHNSVRFEAYMNKGIGNIDNDKEVLNFSTINWYMQVRFDHSIFGYPISSYEVEEIQYANGQIQDVANNQDEKYFLTTCALPAWMHNMFKTYYLQSDKLLATDYGKNNPQEIIKKEVKRVSAYEPKWSKGSKCAVVNVEFKPVYNRLQKFRCI
jgi:hypothetical protein